MMAVLRGTSSSTRTLDERDLASLRPARQTAPRPRKPSILREVTSGIVCFCGEKFGEHQALEFMRHLRAEAGEILNWTKLQKERRRRNSQQWRQKPGVEEQRKQRQWEYRQRPEVKERMQEYSQRPEVRERHAKNMRELRARKKAEQAECG